MHIGLPLKLVVDKLLDFCCLSQDYETAGWYHFQLFLDLPLKKLFLTVAAAPFFLKKRLGDPQYRLPFRIHCRSLFGYSA